MGDSVLASAARFHGHLGPWLVLGLRAGIHARRTFRATPFELNAAVKSPPRPPHSCFIDGVQLGSGCTMGKANITRRDSRSVSVSFSRKGSKRILTLHVRPKVVTEIDGASDIERLARTLFRRPLSRLFVVAR